MKELSSEKWVSKYPGSTSTKDLKLSFRIGVEDFIAQLKKAGARVTISATFRPPERAYLMHWAWKISKKQVKPEDVPSKLGVNIEWVHKNNDDSIKAAEAMVSAYGMTRLKVAPALKSRHTEGNAIDISITWTGNLEIKNKQGKSVLINSLPRDGMNKDLHNIGKSYGVIKFHGGVKDRPHWSSDGR
ncbi:hypothetical protein Xvie_02141 [Xenorhabdus vietnamensis]|uniref:Peptidoglycan-binding domain-containing protein n=1 Tax=Xenorhabdus vietnamensis TaxID=351656 RepID=A0A1Y2SBQ7_9GAMM|nr:peptidoglycan-binding domain-containing protein [Xenorhabdus vietnamensis]OTA16101.1 hypothetical protein Xvie_02141 [Xenorhabdus vietnamensis]